MRSCAPTRPRVRKEEREREGGKRGMVRKEGGESAVPYFWKIMLATLVVKLRCSLFSCVHYYCCRPFQSNAEL